jgi:peptidyl-prolyl cis-trans isomerase A (cyclophilin A)
MTRIPSTPSRPLALRGASSTARLAGAFLVAATLAACGGGGNGGSPSATVTSTAVSATSYAATANLTINGTNLDNISVTSTGCKNIQRLTTPPHASTTTTAYYDCTVSGAFTSNFVIQSNGQTVGTSNNFTVPQPQVTLQMTNGVGWTGTIVISLAGDKMPITVDNFLYYVNTSYYDNQIFDRVVPAYQGHPQFIAQAGVYGAAPDGNLPSPKPTQPPIPFEPNSTLTNVAWSVAMANAGPDTATAEFYINLADNHGLDNGYAVFGTVTPETTAAVQAIVDAPAQCAYHPLTTGTYDCLPIPNMMISTARQSR